MKKLFLFVLIGIAFLSTGCINTKTTITIDKNDNAIVENKVLIQKSVLTYTNMDVEEFFNDKDKGVYKDIFPKNTTFQIDKQKLEENGMIGYNYKANVKSLKNNDIAPLVSLLKPKNTKIIAVNDNLLFRKYVIDAIIEGKKGAVQNSDNPLDQNADKIIQSKLSIKLPVKPQKHNAETITEDNILYWDVSPSKAGNPIYAEFRVINVPVIAISSILVLLVVLLMVYIIFRKNSKNNIQDKTTEKIVSVNEKPKVVKSDNTKKSNRILLILFLSTIGLALLLCLVFFLSAPKISEYLIQSSIEKVYSNNSDKALEMVNFAKKLNFNNETDYSGKFISKGLEEFDKNNLNYGQTFIDMAIKINPAKSKDYEKQIMDKAISSLKSNDIEKATILADLATKIDIDSAKSEIGTFEKQISKLVSTNKIKEALNIIKILEKLEPKKEKLFVQKGDLNAKLKNYDEAIKSYTNAINIKNNCVEAFKARGLIYQKQTNDFDKALYDYNKVISYSYDKNDIAEVRYHMAEIYIKQNRYRDAMNDAFESKQVYESLGKYDLAYESHQLFDYAAQLECDRPNGYCY